MLSWNPKILVKIMQIGIDTNLQIKKFLEKKGHHHPAMGPVSKSVPPPALMHIQRLNEWKK